MFEFLASDYRPLIQDVLAFAICGAALVWGGGPERVIAIGWLLVFEISDYAYRLLFQQEYHYGEVDLYLASTDLLAGSIWIAVALYANRNYPLWIAGLQLLAMTAHMARGFAETVAPVAYAILSIAPGWLQLLILAAGLVRHLLRKRRYGEYRDWRVSRSGAMPSAVSQTLRSGAPGARALSSWRDDLK